MSSISSCPARRRHRLARTAVSLAVLALGTAAFDAGRADVWPPEVKAVNEQHINLFSAADFNLPLVTMDINEQLLTMPGAAGDINYVRYFSNAGAWRDNFKYMLDASNPSSIPVVLGDEMHMFSGMYPYTVINGVQYDGDSQGNALGTININGLYYWQFIGRDGRTIILDPNLNSATLVQYPSGLTRSYYYKTIPNTYPLRFRLQSIVQNDGTMVKYTYDNDDSSGSNAGWYHVASVAIINQAYDYCDPMADHCSLASTWPTASFAGPASGSAPTGQTAIETTTTNNGFGRSYKKDAYGRILGISNLHNYSEDLTMAYSGTSWGVTQVTNGRGDVRTYNVTWASSVYTLAITSSHLSATEYYYFDSSGGGMPTRVVDRLGRPTLYTWSLMDKHVLSKTFPEGNSESFQYDGRFNVITKTRTPKPGTGSALSDHAYYDTACQNINTCNQPNSTVDALGNPTSYTYLPFGGKASELGAPPTSGAARPLKLYAYAQKTAYVRDAGGALVSSGQPIWKLTTETRCQTSPGSSALVCDPNAVRTDITYVYGADGTADSLLIRGRRETSGSVSRLTCYGYDRLRHKISETAPNANLQVCP